MCVNIIKVIETVKIVYITVYTAFITTNFEVLFLHETCSHAKSQMFGFC